MVIYGVIRNRIGRKAFEIPSIQFNESSDSAIRDIFQIRIFCVEKITKIFLSRCSKYPKRNF